MSLVLITGSSGLVGSESVNFFCQKGFDVVGVDNDLRKHFFGKKASTKWQTKILLKKYKNFKNCNIDIRNYPGLKKIFSLYRNPIFNSRLYFDYIKRSSSIPAVFRNR